MAETTQNQRPVESGVRRGGRRRSGRLIETTVVLDQDDVAALDELAAEEGRSRSDLIREAIRHTWLKGRRPIRPGELPAAVRGSMAPSSPEAREAWRARFGSLLAELRESAVTDLTDEELTTFVREEIQARRQEKREAQARDAGRH